MMLRLKNNSSKIMHRVMWASIGCHGAVTFIYIGIMFAIANFPPIVVLMTGPPLTGRHIEVAFNVVLLAVFATFIFCPFVSLGAAACLPDKRPVPYVLAVEMSFCLMQAFVHP